MGLLDDRQSQLLIDGKLVAGSGGTFPTVNPATEEVLGVAADATADDMGRAIEAARRAFDDTDWSTNTELRVRCIRQLQEALTKHVEELRELTIAEVGAPLMLTSMAQLEGPIADLSFCADTAESYQWTTDAGIASPMGIKTHRTIAREAVGVVGAITPWNFPHQINLAKIGPALAAGNTVVLKPAPDTPWCAAVLGELILEHTDIPAGRRQHRHVERSRRRRAAVERPTGGHGFVHRVDEHRPRGDGRRRGDAEEGVPRTRRQVGVPRARRRGSRWRLLDVGVHRIDARRAGLRDHHPAGGAPCPLRRSRRGGGGHDGGRSSRATRRTPAPSAGR